MKKTISVSLGRCCFILDEDAYAILDRFFDNYRSNLLKTESAISANEVVVDVETRIADLLRERLCGREVVDAALVSEVIGVMGFKVPDASQEAAPHDGASQATGTSGPESGDSRGRRKIYRDGNRRAIGGVCSGLSYYLDVDVALMRVLFVLAMILGFAGFWIYLVFWIIVPEAKTPFEKCEMRGIPATPENLKNV